ncbi:unnamed protein product [Alopecurus aequalis]
MAGIAQPALKRLRRDVRARALEDSAAERSASRAARARAPEDAAAERGARRVAHHGDGRNVPDTAGARDYDEAPDAEATTRGRLTLGAGYWVIRRRPGESIEGILRVGDIEWIVPPRHPVPEQHPVTGVKEHELEPIMEPGPATDGLPSPTAPLMLRVEDRVRVRHRGIADADERAGAGALVLDRQQARQSSGYTGELELGERYGAAGARFRRDMRPLCIRARHCIEYERRYGAGTFPYQLTAVGYLKDACEAEGVWNPIKGAKARAVLELMRDQELWVRTEEVQGWERCLLRFRSFCMIPAVDRERSRIALVIRLDGPIIGVLYAGPDYRRSDHDDTHVYRGHPGEPSNHGVVCMAYRFTTEGEMHLRVLDNMASHGPLRWILYQAFRYFFNITVDPLDRAELQQQQHNNNTVARWLSDCFAGDDQCSGTV